MTKKEKWYWTAGVIAFIVVLGYVVNMYMSLPK